MVWGGLSCYELIVQKRKNMNKGKKHCNRRAGFRGECV
jgi:hypothetical protein